VEASALPASAGLTRARLGLGAPLLRLRPDEQLVSLFRAGNEDAFRVIHDRYRARMLAYARQMLASSSADPEDAVQEIFVRAYGGLRANRRDLALRAWLYRIAHNRCVDELRRPRPLAVEAGEDLREAPGLDPHARVEQREALRRLIVDVQHLPEQQRSALLMRELGGMPYADLAGALGVSVPAVKSLLVRARVGLAQASEARDTACASICEDLVVAHDRGVRASGRARRHMRDCTDCRQFRTEVQGMSRSLGLLIPALGPLAVAAKLIGLGGIGGGGSAAAGSGTSVAAGATATAAGATSTAAVSGGAVAGATGTAAVTGTTAAAGGTVAVTATAGAAVSAGASTGALATAGAAAGTAHVATLLAATAIAAGGAIGIQHEVTATHRPVRTHHTIALAAVPRTGAAPAVRLTPSPTEATAPVADPSSTSAGTAAGAADASRMRVPNAATRTALPAKATTTAATGGSAASQSSPGVTTLASSSGVPAASTSVTATTPSTTDPTTTTTSTTPTATDPTTSPVTSSDPTGTDPTSTDPTTTVPVTTPADPTSTTVASVTPVPGATTGGDPVTSATPVTGSGRHSANPGTATGIVPTVSSATTWAGTGRSWRRIRLQTWRDAPRGVAAGWTTVLR
jgi:RNA polymerase sigma factor (sigma-70 family)